MKQTPHRCGFMAPDGCVFVAGVLAGVVWLNPGFSNEQPDPFRDKEAGSSEKRKTKR